MNELYIFGAGGHGSVVAEIADLLGYTIAGFIDDDPSRAGAAVLKWKVIGGRAAVPDGAMVALGIGSNTPRAELMTYGEARGWQFPALVHPSAVVSSSAVLGAGAVIMAQVAVNARARIGRGCVLNTSSSVDHDCVVYDFAHIAPGVRLAGSVTVGERTLIGIGSCARPWTSIGPDCVIGAGSAIVSDIPAGATAFGNPARVQGE
ncbi:MAG: acetyltransferase [Armatimonadota bacterium]|nr:acetyltransferase [Armatimonadota bacterium]